jgi:Methyltransferase domain
VADTRRSEGLSSAAFIGCQRYTKHYPSRLTAHGAECWTIDIDPTVARWGTRRRHTIGEIRDGSDHWLPASFDTIILNGVFGFGLDCVRDQDAALRACRLLLKEEGWLILGWNFDRSAEPSELPTLRDHFQPSSFPGLAQRQMFDKSTHVYGTFRLQTMRSVPRADTTALELAGRRHGVQRSSAVA